jgi:hypothetical protein
MVLCYCPWDFRVIVTAILILLLFTTDAINTMLHGPYSRVKTKISIEDQYILKDNVMKQVSEMHYEDTSSSDELSS